MLRLEGVSAAYGNIQALCDVTLEVTEGQMVAIVGPNGAGKSTMFKVISGVVPAKSGRIMYEGADLLTLDPADRAARGIAHVPEGRQVFKSMTIAENLEMGAYSVAGRVSKRQAVDRAYELFPVLAERRRDQAGTLSGGQQQMLAIGRALASSPRLLMLDEPSLGLAPILVETIFRVCIDINSKGLPILLVEQNASKALEIAHRAYVLETGSIVQTGTGKELLSSPDVQRAYLGM